jgi:hypothetical protein
VLKARPLPIRSTLQKANVIEKVLSSQVRWLAPIIPAAEETEIRKIAVQGHPGEKVHQDPISTNKLGGKCLSSQHK